MSTRPAPRTRNRSDVPRVVVGVEAPSRAPARPVGQQRGGAPSPAAAAGDRLRTAPGPLPGRPGAYVAASVEKTAVEALARLGEEFRGDVNLLPAHVATGPARRVLLDALDHGARMLVVGRRGLNATERVLVGSTSIAVAGRSPVTVVVVPETWEPAQHTSAPVIVGVTLGEDDDPHENDDLLRFAFDHARELASRSSSSTPGGPESPELVTGRRRGPPGTGGRPARQPARELADGEYPDVVVDPRTPAESSTDRSSTPPASASWPCSAGTRLPPGTSGCGSGRPHAGSCTGLRPGRRRPPGHPRPRRHRNLPRLLGRVGPDVLGRWTT